MLRRGFTLVEILIAMAVFLIGIVSILAVFPVGIKSSTISTNHSVAMALAESLDDALTLSLRQYDGVASVTPVRFYHDGLGASGTDVFQLPVMEYWQDNGLTLSSTSEIYTANGHSKPTWYPIASPSNPPTYAEAYNPNNVHATPAALASVTGNKGGKISTLVGTDNKDYADPLGQYSFRCMVQEYKTPNDADNPDEDPVNALITVGTGTQPQFYANNGTQAEVVNKLYQFTLYVYRGWKDVQLDMTSFDPANIGVNNCWDGGAAVNYQWEDQMKHPSKIERFEWLIYAPGARDNR